MSKAKGFGGQRPRVPKAAEDPEAKPAPAKRTRLNAQAARARAGREQETRASQDLHPGSNAPWAPPTSLDAPPPRKGFKQKWIRIAIFGRPDVQNMSRKFKEGWLPRKSDTVPKSFHVPSIKSGQFAGYIGVEGSLLCEMPEARVAQRNAHYRKRAEQMAQDIERNMGNVNRSIPHHAGFGRITKQATTRVLTHKTNDAGVDTGEEIEA